MSLTVWAFINSRDEVDFGFICSSYQMLIRIKRKIDTSCIVPTVNLEELAKLTTIKITIRIAALIGIILIIGLFL